MWLFLSKPANQYSNAINSGLQLLAKISSQQLF